MEGSALHLENRTQVIVWLRENYKHATTTSVSKRSVFAHYLEACKRQSVATPISHTYFGKLVRKAFPDVRCNRKGPRGSAQQHYRLIRADGGDADEFLSAHFGDELEAEEAAEEEYRAKRAKRSSSKKKTTAAALRKNGVSTSTAGRVRVRAAATAAASTISRMISADQAPANLTEAWSFSSAPSSPSFSATASVPSSPGAQAYAESDEDDHDEEEYTEELIEEEYVEEEQQEPEQEQEEDDEDNGDDDAYESDDASSTGANGNEEVEFNFDLPQFEITPGEESPGTSFSYEAGHSISGHEQNMRLQQQLQQSRPVSTQAQAQFAIPQPPQQHQQHQQSMGYFEPSAFYDFVSPDLEMPLSAINQVNLAEDFGWSVPSMPSAVVVDNCASAYHHQQQAHYYQQQQQQPVHSYLLADQLPATQCSDLAEWVAHYCN